MNPDGRSAVMRPTPTLEDRLPIGLHAGARSGRPGISGLAMVVIALMLCGCSQAASPTRSSSPVVMFSASTAKKIASAISSADPTVRLEVLSPELASQVGTQAILPAGTTLRIDSGTFRVKGPDSGTVTAVTTGQEPGHWVLYLQRDSGQWKIVDTVQQT